MEGASALSIGISPSKISFEKNDEFKEVAIFNPNEEGVFISSKSENYVVVPKEFFVSRENLKIIKVYAKICSDENITFSLNSNSNLFPAVKLSVDCKDRERSTLLKKAEPKSENSLFSESVPKNPYSNLENWKSAPDEKTGIFVSFFIVISGLGIYFSMNRKGFYKIKGLLKKSSRILLIFLDF
ncbi:MAG: hypothetical protein ACP5OZ_05215 [Candidatus Woesearchaeota archaeon]